MNQRGLTLIELLVSTAVMSIVLAGVTGALFASQKTYSSQAATAGIQTNLRIAASQLEKDIARAGYGIDPNYAFEPWAMSDIGEPTAIRDNSGPDGSDELVIYYRDPMFSRRLAAASDAELTLETALADGEIAPGEPLFVVCQDGSGAAYVTAAKAADTTIVLADGPFPFLLHPTRNPMPGCASTGFVSKVLRRHYFIARMSQPDGQTRPMLLLSRGVDLDGDGDASIYPKNWPGTVDDLGDSELVALDIENLQIAYGINQPTERVTWAAKVTQGPDSDGNWMYGDEPGVVEAPHPTKPNIPGGLSLADPYDKPGLLANDSSCEPGDINPETSCSYGGQRRYTGHPGNIRTVRFSLSARSTSEDPKNALTSPVEPVPGEPAFMENLSAADVTPTRHLRQIFRGSSAARNVLQRKHFAPPVAEGLNVAGG